MSLKKLKEIQHELKTQDNRITSDPIFLVQEEEKIWGFDSDYASDYIWYNVDNQYEASEEEVKSIENDEPDDEDFARSEWEKCFYQTKWIPVQPFFTEKAAQQYIDGNYYRHKGELRIYADSLYRNPEMKMIRDYILNLE